MEQISPKYLIIINTCDLPCHSAIMKLCNRGAAGPNNIPPLLLKCAISPVSQALCLLFTQVRHNSRVPAEWQGRILSLYKGKGSMSQCSNYRPISLLSCPGKVCSHTPQLPATLSLAKLKDPNSQDLRPGGNDRCYLGSPFAGRTTPIISATSECCIRLHQVLPSALLIIRRCGRPFVVSECHHSSAT